MENSINIKTSNSVVKVTLSRPQVLNALNIDMIRAMATNISIWKNSSDVSAVVIEGEGDKAFCAGGDVVGIYHARESNPRLGEDFFKEEYILNTEIKNFSKPWIALLDGVSMGGGLGLAVHGSHRIVTEKVIAGMPETSIGLFPDVGGGYFLSRLKGQVGLFIALTCYRLNAEDCIYSGIATNYVKHSDISTIVKNINKIGKNINHGYISEILLPYEIPVKNAPLSKIMDKINWHFKHDNIGLIFASLKATGEEWEENILKILSEKSPTSLAITIKQIRDSKNMSFTDCMIMEYRMSQACMKGHDFYEGVRANLVDKDRNPKWFPESINKVNISIINSHFKSLKEKDLFLEI